MKLNWIIPLAALALMTLGTGCTGAKQRSGMPPTIIESNHSYKNLPQKTAIILIPNPKTVLGRELADSYFKTLQSRLSEENERLRLVTSKDDGFPDFMSLFLNGSLGGDAFSVITSGREQAYQALIATRISDLRPRTSKSGFLWLRTTRYEVSFTAEFDLYDPFTAAKILSEVKEKTVKIDESDYQGLADGSTTAIEDLFEAAEDLAEAFAEKAAEKMKAQPWKSAVHAVDGQSLTVNTGGYADLQAGDRLEIFDMRRLWEGHSGQKFIVPGFRIASATITSIENGSAMARIEEMQQPIEAGDLAVAIK